MCIQEQCAPEFHNDFWKKNIILFFNKVQELIIASLFIIEAILNPFSATFDEQCTGNISASFQHHFPCKKVHTVLNKIRRQVIIKNGYFGKIFSWLSCLLRERRISSICFKYISMINIKYRSKQLEIKVYPRQNQNNRAHAVTACIGL